MSRVSGFTGVTRWFSFVALLGMVAGIAGAADSFKVDAVHSSVIFRITHLNTSASYGRFNDPEGRVTRDGDNVSLEVTVKAANVDTFNAKRDEHLRGPDFFNAAEFPTITFKSTASKKLAEKSWEVTGDLTLLGKTNPVTLKLNKIGEGKDPWGGERIGYETTLTIKRSDYGMNYMPDALGDNVLLIISIEGVKE